VIIFCLLLLGCNAVPDGAGAKAPPTPVTGDDATSMSSSSTGDNDSTPLGSVVQESWLQPSSTIVLEGLEPVTQLRSVLVSAGPDVLVV
jgi:hypothetical protein